MPHFTGAVRIAISALAVSAVAIVATIGISRTRSNLLTEPPELRAENHVLSLTLHAALNREGKDSFVFEGIPSAPTLRLSPGDQLRITYVNDLPVKPTEKCAITPCMDMTNLHFHGFAVSPMKPQDDVLDMIAMPGQTLHYVVDIPKDHPPGLYWYHTHPHGESHRQVLDGMSGALVIEGINTYNPEVAELPERVLIVRGRSIEHDSQATELKRRVELDPAGCGGEHEEPEEIFTVNGSIRPGIEIAPGERQFWRIANASADRYVDLQLEGQPFEIVAIDGMPIAYHDPEHPTRMSDHYRLPPAGRLEVIVKGPAEGTHSHLISRCVDTGTTGDPNPAMILADIRPKPGARATHKISETSAPPSVKIVDLAAEEKVPPRFSVIFSEDSNGFYINGKKFAMDDAPMVRAKVGEYQHWRIVNATAEVHPMHIHQVHFLVYAINGKPVTDPLWMDTVDVSYGGTVDVIMDFTDPVIRGMSVFHCHLLNHEDKGMMAKILFE
jgi:FtsP/CotA-like multicopper oxidase with cupredoxin domain